MRTDPPRGPGRQVRRLPGEVSIPAEGAVHPSALDECNALINYYARWAGKSRNRYQILEVALLVVGASISVVALAAPNNGIPTAVLGGLVVILTGLRQVFHWHENYVRFTGACMSLIQERRLYHAQRTPYDDLQARDQRLTEAVNRVESQETKGWSELMQSKSSETPANA